MPTSSRHDILITESRPALSSRVVSDKNMLESSDWPTAWTAPATLLVVWRKRMTELTLSAAPWFHQLYNREYWINVAYSIHTRIPNNKANWGFFLVTIGKHPNNWAYYWVYGIPHTPFWDDVSGFLPVLSRHPNRFLDSTIRWFVISPSNIPMKSGLNLMVPILSESLAIPKLINNHMNTLW